MHRFRVVVIAAVAAIMLIPAAPSPAAIPSNDAIFKTIEDMVSFAPRRVGTPGIDRTVDYVARRFHDLGMSRVHVEETPTYSWTALDHSLTFAGQHIDESPITYAQSPKADAVGDSSTPPGGLRAPIVDVGLATPADVQAHDVKGKIVMFDLKFLLPVAGLLPDTEFLWDPEQTMTLSPQTLLTANPYITTFTNAIGAAQDAGAVGVIGVLADYFNSNKYYNEFYRRQLVSVPGMWVTKAEGDKLRGLMASHPEDNAEMVMHTRRAKVPSHVVVGFLDGKSTDAIQIHSHMDSGHSGAVEDGSGTAEVLALAEHYAAEPASTREKTLMFTLFDSHWAGYSAHNAFLKRHIFARDPKRDPNRIVADVTLEHIAKHALRGPNGELQISDKPEPRGIFETLAAPLKAKLIQSVVSNDLRRTAILNGSTLQPIGIPTDSSGWVILGVPTASFISGPMYLYDAADTLDKVLRNELHAVAKTFIELTDAIDETPSDQLGAIPLAKDMGKYFVGDPSTIPNSVDRVWTPPVSGCMPAGSGRAVTKARIARGALRFVSRRTVDLTAVAVLRGGKRVALPGKALTACRRYRLAVPRGVRRVELTWREGGRAVVRR